MSTLWWFFRKRDVITNVIRIYPQGTMNVCTNFVPMYQVDVEILHRISDNFDLTVVLEEKSGHYQSQQDSSSEESI